MAEDQGEHYLYSETTGELWHVCATVPPKHLNRQQIAALAREWDAASTALCVEWCPDIKTYFVKDDVYEVMMQRCHDAELAYGRAVADRNMAEIVRLQQRKRVPNFADYDKLLDRRVAARIRNDLLEALGQEFFTAREVMDINNENYQAEALSEIAQAKFNLEVSRQRADKAAGINRS